MHGKLYSIDIIAASMTNSIDSCSEVRTCLYEIMGVLKSASFEEIKKAYRVRALQCHPDKDSSPEAKANFQKLSVAYTILKSSESRALYDETGFIEGEGFDQAADFFRTKFGRISEDDIVEFEKKYKGSLAEREDVVEFYQRQSGDVSKLLEWVPLSEPEEVDRFISMMDDLIKDGVLMQEPKYAPSLGKLRKNAAKMKKEQSKFVATESSDISALALAIQKRRAQPESFFEDLIAKYAKPSKKKRSA